MVANSPAIDADSYTELFRNIEAAFRNIGVTAFILDETFHIRDVNNAGLEFTEYGYNELIGERISRITDDLEVLQSVVSTVRNDDTWTGDIELKTRTGKTVFGEGSVAPIRVHGTREGYVAVFIDTTKRRRFQNTAEVLNRLLRHDLRNELQVAHGMLQMAHGEVADEKVSEWLEQAQDHLVAILNKSDRARNLRESLERSYESDHQQVRVDHAVNDALVDPLREFDQAEFRFEQFPAVWVRADELLSIVIESILENAVVHNDADTPVVEVVVEEWEQAVIIAVSDNGPGIQFENTDVIFGREEVDHLTHGSGISLFFADTVIESYDGDLWVEDNDPTGCTFKIRLRKI